MSRLADTAKKRSGPKPKPPQHLAHEIGSANILLSPPREGYIPGEAHQINRPPAPALLQVLEPGLTQDPPATPQRLPPGLALVHIGEMQDAQGERWPRRDRGFRHRARGHGGVCGPGKGAAVRGRLERIGAGLQP